MPLEKRPRKESEDSPGWTFGKEGDYVRECGPPWERYAALAVVGVWVTLRFHEAGLGYAIRLFASFIVPLVAVWRPETFSAENAKAVRIGGWLWLLLPLWTYLATLFFQQLWNL